MEFSPVGSNGDVANISKLSPQIRGILRSSLENQGVVPKIQRKPPYHRITLIYTKNQGLVPKGPSAVAMPDI